MKISIIVPVYNAEKYIEKLIKSILIQTYKNYELILIDDGSTDLTYSIMKKYQNNKIRVFTKKNDGVGRSRKLGYKYATGDLIFFCDSDDYLASNDVLEKINKIFENKDIDVLMFNALDISEKGENVVNCFSKSYEPGFHDIDELNNCFLFGPLFLKIFKSEKLSEDCFCDYNNFEDTYTTYMYLNECNNFYYENDIYYIYDETVNKQSLTKIKKVDKFIKTIDLIKMMNLKSKLKESCCISAFNYFLYLIDLVETKQFENKDIEVLKNKMPKLEKIFINNLSFLETVEDQKKIKKYFKYKSKNFKKKLIIVDGMSTTGKSTISKRIYEQILSNDIKVKWMHEESYNDINLLLDIKKSDIKNKEIIKDKMNELINKWQEFNNKIMNDEFVYILDSNFFKNIHDYLLHSDLTEEEIINFYKKIMNIFDKKILQFILLIRENIKESFSLSFEKRGDFWKNHFLKPIFNESSYREKKSYLSNTNLKYSFEKDYQVLIQKIYDEFDFDKIKFKTDEGDWDQYLNVILNKLQLNKYENKINNFDYKKYIGEYVCEGWNVKVYYDEQTNKLFLSAFWPEIELEYIGNDTFNLDKFPLKIIFLNNKLQFQGELVWEMKNKDFLKKEEKVLKKYKNYNI